MKLLKITAQYIINYILPPSCLICSEFTVNDGFCGSCLQKLNFIARPYCQKCGQRLDIDIFDDIICAKCYQNPPFYEKARSLLKFDEHSKKIIHAFKYYDRIEVGKIFAQLICHRYLNDIKDVDYVVPVPMNRFKRLIRMYNQSQILANNVALKIKKPVINDLLIKQKWTKSQTFLSKTARKINIAGSLIFNSKYDIKDKKILLVDDVITTGVTIKECSLLLKNSGAGSVRVVTIAMT